MADNDSQIDLKKRARRRLVGSAALALLAAIVLPMVMDHEPRPPSPDVQIRIPSQEGSNFTSRVIGGKAPAPSQPVAGAVGEETSEPDGVSSGGQTPPRAQQGPLPAPNPTPMAKSEPGTTDHLFKPGEELLPPQKKLEPKAVEPKPEPKKVEPKKPEVKPDSKLKEKEQKEKEQKEKERAKALAEAERAKALLSGSTPPKEDATATKSHVVSLGAYREAGNVASLRAKLKAEGYPSYVENVGDKVRVRAGPFPNKAAADKAAARIQKVLGVQASVAAKP